MTEDEQLSRSELRQTLEQLRESGATERKLMLFAAGCCHRITHLVTDRRSRDAIATLMRYADGQATPDEMAKARTGATSAADEAAHSVWVSMLGRTTADRAARNMYGLYSLGYERAREVEEAVSADVAYGAHQAAALAAACGWGLYPDHFPTTRDVWNTAFAASATRGMAECVAQRAMVLDIFGNPFRPVVFAPEWRTSTAVAIAKAMYESRDFSAMPILADALQDAECENEDVLAHCRGPGPHVRGCWVVDLVLGKE